MTESIDANSNRRDPYSEAFKKFIVADWAPYSDELPETLPAAEYTPKRREALAAEFAGTTLVIPAGPLKVRSNDTDYRFRPHTAFTYYTGLGEDREPDAVLLVNGEGSRLYFRPRAPRTDREFYADPRYGEVWVGQRDSLEELQSAVGFECRAISELPEALREAGQQLLVIRDADPSVTALVDEARGDIATALDAELERSVSEARFIKDEFEIAEMRRACDATRIGFEAVARELPNAVANGRGERWVEGIFGLHARHLGNAVGYDTISAGGDHANTLHWIRNDGDLVDGDLLLLDAGVEVNTLYTADVTRTMPVNGKFTEPQRRVYEAVLAAQTAGIEACRDGKLFADVHQAAITVLAHFFEELGILPTSAEESRAAAGGVPRSGMGPRTTPPRVLSAPPGRQGPRENYRLGTLKAGMVITVEPGIYFKSTDLLVPEEYRGIGIRIEDDILITDGDPVNLSAALPREADDVEKWLAKLQK